MADILKRGVGSTTFFSIFIRHYLSMKLTLFTPLFVLATVFSARSQGFIIDTDFYDSISPTSYDVHFTGHAFFTDSMQVYYSVKTNDSVPGLLLLDSVDFTVAEPVFPQGFTYNAQDSTLQIAFGNYPTMQLILELYSFVEGDKREHIYVNIHNFETYLEDEE